MIKKKRQSIILQIMYVMLATLTALGTGCDRKETSPEFKAAASAYKVVDSGVWSAESTDEKTVWLDNDRVVFVSNKTLTPGPDPKFLTVWNTATGKVDLSHQLTGLICGRNGQIMFAAKDQTTGKPKHYRGPLENPQEHPAPSPDMHLDQIYDCDWVPKATWGSYPTRFPYSRKLLAGNYLETVAPKTQTSQGRSVYHEHLNGQGIEMPFFLPSYRISYSEFLDVYVADKGMNDPAKPETRSFWLLERNGNLQEQQFPKAMLKGKQRIYLLKQGYLSEYNDGKYTASDPFDRGLWLLQGEKVARLIVGAIYGVSISPDGCKTAFIHAENLNKYMSQKKPYCTVKFINFCIGETKP